MKMRHIALYALMLLALLTACGGSASYADGTYTGTSSVYEGDEDGSDRKIRRMLPRLTDSVGRQREGKKQNQNCNRASPDTE